MYRITKQSIWGIISIIFGIGFVCLGSRVLATSPIIPVTQKAIAQEFLKMNFDVDKKSTFEVGGVSYELLLTSLSATQAKIEISADTMGVVKKFSFEDNETISLDTNEDTYPDLQMTYYDMLDTDTAYFEISNYTDGRERKNPVTINDGTYGTEVRQVLLHFNAESVNEVAVSNEADITGEFVPYVQDMRWQLSEGKGIKTVYVTFKSTTGDLLGASDTIELYTDESSEEQELEAKVRIDTYIASQKKIDVSPVQEKSSEQKKQSLTTCPLIIGQAYKVAGTHAIFYITESKLGNKKVCTKRVFTKPHIFLSHFDSWSDVKVASKESLDAIPYHALKNMYLGPKFDPQYGAIVKSPDDPKVYLLLGNKKYWINSPEVFNGLGYAWTWIEDVDPTLLDIYAVGQEITTTTTHPNFTIVKYKNSPKVYRLESKPGDPLVQVKRHISSPAAFEKLKYRWDRIVTIPESEVYDDGEVLE